MTIRRCVADDLSGVLSLLRITRGLEFDAGYEGFFRWKHSDSPLGRSPAWVATHGDMVVGFRTFLPWEFVDAGAVIRAVRAVDTATHPDYQRRGIFTALTATAIDELASDGVSFIFNTPNSKSVTGYLKMGWVPVGPVPVMARPRSASSILRLRHARVPAEKWSAPCDVGAPAGDLFSQREQMTSLLASVPVSSGMSTRRTPEFIAWRYGHLPLNYRGLLAGDSLAQGVVIFRLRRRGPIVEAAICDTLLPDCRPGIGRKLIGRILRESGADVAVHIGGRRTIRALSVPLPGQGPMLVWRGLAAGSMPARRRWTLALGDIELF